MGIIDFILRRESVYSLRKKYDRVREKTDKERNSQKKIYVLRILDQTEPTLVALEEHNMAIGEKTKMKKYVKSNILEAKLILKKDYQMSQQTQRQIRK
ncbi:MAG: hypothetical protein V1802_01350 [Candidatus Aenigmatarchaeota archaeon]